MDRDKAEGIDSRADFIRWLLRFELIEAEGSN